MRADRARAGTAGGARTPYGLMRLRRWVARRGGMLSLPVVLALLLFQTFGGCTCPDVTAHGMPAGPAAVAVGMGHHPEGGTAHGHGARHVGPACSCCGAGLCAGVGLLPRAPALPDPILLSRGAPPAPAADRPPVVRDAHLRPPGRGPPFASWRFLHCMNRLPAALGERRGRVLDHRRDAIATGITSVCRDPAGSRREGQNRSGRQGIGQCVLRHLGQPPASCWRPS